MSYNYQAPGVYIEDLPSRGARPIESVATSVLAIVGLYNSTTPITKVGTTEAQTDPRPNQPILVTNWSQFTQTYGGLDQQPPIGYLHQAMYGYFLNGGRQAYIVGLPISPADAAGTITAEMFKQGINTLEAYEEITLLVCPDLFRVFAPEPKSGVEVQKAMVEHCKKMKDRIAILDMPNGQDVSGAKTWLETELKVDDKYAAIYYPWLKVTNTGLANPPDVPPSGHIAGVYARVDSERGVHKAPANEVVRGATGLMYNATRNDQETLNPARVNCIRTFPGQGIRIWGARTLSSDAQWQYINVQRLFANIEDSIIQNTRWVVFEPNDPILWAAIRRDISAYLMRLWHQGALFGSTPEEAFYVKCDAETNPPEVIQAGYCVIEVGIAPVRPAEFVVIRIGQWDGSTSASE